MAGKSFIQFGLVFCLCLPFIIMVHSAPACRSDHVELLILDGVDLMTKQVCDGIVKTPAGLNIREQPTSKSKKVGAYKNGTRLKILESKRGENVDGVRWWYRTNKGWVSGRYLVFDCCKDQQQDQNPAAASVQTPTEQQEPSEMEKKEDFSDEKALA